MDKRILALVYTVVIIGLLGVFSIGVVSGQTGFDDSDVVFEWDILENPPDGDAVDVTGERGVEIYAVNLSTEQDSEYVNNEELVYTSANGSPVMYSTWSELEQSVDFEITHVYFAVQDDGETVHETGFIEYNLPHDETIEYDVESVDESDITAGGGGSGSNSIPTEYLWGFLLLVVVGVGGLVIKKL